MGAVKELSEKEKMAAALFGGLGGAGGANAPKTSAPAPKAFTAPAPKPAAAPKTQPAPAAPIGGMDLLGFGDDDAPAAVSAVAQDAAPSSASPSAKSAVDDLLLLD